MDDLRRRVAEKKAKGLYGVDALMEASVEDDGEPFGLDDLERLRTLAVQHVDIQVAASDKPLVGGAISKIKRLLVRGTSQPVYGLSAQATAFNGALLSYVSALAREVSALRRDVDGAASASGAARTEAAVVAAELADALARVAAAEGRVSRMDDAALPERIARLERGAAPAAGPPPAAPPAGAPAPGGDPVRIRLDATEAGDPAARWTRYGELLAGRGRVLHLGAGTGRALAHLGDGAEGVEADAELVAAAAAEGRAVRHAEPVAFTRALAAGSVGGILVTDVVERLDGPGVRALADALAHALAPDGQVVVEGLHPAATWAVGNEFWRDAGRRRPLHPDAVRFALESEGLGSTRIEFFDAPEELRLAAPGAGDLGDLVARLNDVLFGPRRYAVHAAR